MPQQKLNTFFNKRSTSHGKLGVSEQDGAPPLDIERNRESEPALIESVLPKEAVEEEASSVTACSSSSAGSSNLSTVVGASELSDEVVPLPPASVYSIFDKRKDAEAAEPPKPKKPKVETKAGKGPAKAGKDRKPSRTVSQTVLVDVPDDEPLGAPSAAQDEVIAHDFAPNPRKRRKGVGLGVPGNRIISRTPSAESLKPPSQEGSTYCEPIDITYENETSVGSREEPIVIPSSPVGPLKLPPHPFFAARPVTNRTASNQDLPILIEDSPVQTPIVPHPFFAARSAPLVPPKTSVGSSRSKLRTPVDAPWPTGDSQHVRGIVSCFPVQSTVFPERPAKRRRLNSENLAESRRDLKAQAIATVEAKQREAEACSEANTTTPPVESGALDDRDLDDLPDEHIAHPALARFSNPIPASQNAETWTERWRPRRASEVLGNEQNAQYLKSWLQALELHIEQAEPKQDLANDKGKTAKKRVVVRTVDKKARKRRKHDDDELDWIVDDDIEDWDDTEGSAGTESEDGTATTNSRLTADSMVDTRRFGNVLTNTILLSGPSGSGKTTAVYACAQELGWDVFEVYPGVGKRSGLGVTALVGGVGRNHLVRRGAGTGSGDVARGKSAKSAFERLLGGKALATDTKRVEDDVVSLGGTEDEPIDVDGGTNPSSSGFGFLETTETARAEPKVRQSLILLEEADVLFQPDAGFWQAVVAMVKESRRPVVITCNDPSLVPVLDLPLQTHLAFAPPQEEVAVSYLQLLSATEGHPVSRTRAREIWDGARYTGEGREALGWEGGVMSWDGPKGDLRRAVNALQMSSCREEDELGPALDVDLDAKRFDTEDGTEWLTRLKGYGTLLDCASFDDACLARPAQRVLDACEIDRYTPSPDDELGHPALLKPPSPATDIGQAAYARDSDFAAHIASLARSSSTSPHLSLLLPQPQPLMLSRHAHLSHLLTYLSPLIPISSHLLPRAPVIVDYAPYVRAMVDADDVLAEADAAGVSRVGRPARAAAARGRTRAQYVRWVGLGEEGLDAARRGGFEV